MKNISLGFISVIFTFFVMGFTDTVGIASNYVKADLNLTDAGASIFMTMVFLWFLILAIPTSMLMNRIGRKRTALLSLFIAIIAFSIPLTGGGYYTMFAAFTTLGIANVLMQTSVNALMSSIVSQDQLESGLTFGQFVKAIASFTAPYIAMAGAVGLIPSFGLGWRVMFLVYALLMTISMVWLWRTNIKEQSVEAAAGFRQTAKLLRDPFVILCFLGIVSHVGIDVGTNSFAPKILIERVGISLSEAGAATSLYFISRTVGCLIGAILMRKLSVKLFYGATMALMALAMISLLFVQSGAMIYLCVALVGLFNANAFSIIYSQALLHMPKSSNEMSGLMIMGLVGGAIFPALMGAASDSVGQTGAVAVMLIAVLYMLGFTAAIRR